MLLGLNFSYGFTPLPVPSSTVSPRVLRDNEKTAVASAVIYNQAEVRRRLGIHGTFGGSDLLFRAFQRLGLSAFSLIEGEYAFAVFDSSTQMVTLVRDHIGQRPLYWKRQESNSILVGTSLHDLCHSDPEKWVLDEQRVADYLYQNQFKTGETFFRGVRAVAPGGAVVLSRERVVEDKWWSALELEKQSRLDPNEAYGEINRLLDQAVNQRGKDAEHLSTHLSGGVDSSLVTIVAAKTPFLKSAYTWSPAECPKYPKLKENDERDTIEKIASESGIEVHYGTSSYHDFDQLAERPLEFEGTADLVDELAVLRTARAIGTDVILSGWGGDQAFSAHGLGHPAWLLARGRLKTLLAYLQRNGCRDASVNSCLKLLWRSALVPHFPDFLYKRYPPFKNLYAGGAFPSRLMQECASRGQSESPLRLVGDANLFSRALLDEGYLSERMTTWHSWAAPFGITYRYPLLDRRLLEFILSLPHSLRFGDGSPRYLAKRACGHRLPAPVLKYDAVNEKFRRHNRLSWWHKLGRDAHNGRFDEPCPWLDMVKLRQVITQGPCGNDFEDLQTFAKMFVALRVWALFRRWA